MKKAIFLLCLLSTFFVFSQTRITGKVITSKNVPLEGAAVYLNNTSIGTTSDDNGEFELTIKDGNYDLIVSYLGFETIQHSIIKGVENKNLIFKMVSKANMLNEVVISKKNKMSKEEREYFMRQFKRNFLGKTNLAKECKILNEEVIEFDFDKLSRTLDASVSKPIQIKHEGLGYLITYDLVHFKQTPKNIEYLGYTRYQKLKGSKRKERKWNKKRQIAYNGSTMHFFRSIVNGSLKEEGFIVDHFKRIPNPARPHDSIIKKARRELGIVSSKSGNITLTLGNSKISNNSKIDSLQKILRRGRLKKTIDVDITKNLSSKDFTFNKNNTNYISFTDHLKVKYMNEKEEENYRPGPARLNHQVSIITLFVRQSPFDKLGVLARPLDLFLTGYWGYEKLANALPLDYNSTKN
ncbi:carboxypeptidase-like regulatory domain-containing protein [Pseudotenacibaculum sp. MALMAid0570]|uniref:carboxypeptidase-like regulatory domain-containing protein n=1 Tax=Pseudotenacibaculum sp. MALMAid0570 TaxID=3143938 RepID=UPI0032DF2B4A